MVDLSIKTSIEILFTDLFGKAAERFTYIKDKLDSTAFLIGALAYSLFPLIARSVVFTSARTFKRRCDKDKVASSRQTLQELGGKKVFFPMPDGHKVAGMHLDATKCLEALIAKGAEKGIISLPDAKTQKILWLPSEKQDLRLLVERMGVSICQHEGRSYIELGIPQDSLHSSENVQPGTMIYAPGSGHLFEFRRKTIGNFLLNYGMNILVFHYSSTGKSEGQISEQATLDNVEGAYQYLKAQGITDEKILGYGHCLGGGPILNLASKYPINVLADRTYLTMGKFAKRRIITILHLPRLLHFLVAWIEPVVNKCFYYNNKDKIKQVKGHIAILGATRDNMIPETYMQRLFDNAVLARSRVKFLMEADHDMNLFEDEKVRLAFGKFLTNSQLIGY